MIPFTRYHLPNGRKTQESFPCPEGFEEYVNRFLGQGGYFEVEILSTGVVSLTAGFPDDGDIAIRICKNKEGEVSNAVRMLLSDVKKWLLSYDGPH